MKTTSEQDWKSAWRNVLAQCKRRVFLLDLDGTVWQDILVILNEAHGPVDDGVKRWKKYDRAFKVEGTMTNGAHLEAEYRDLLTVKSLEELVAWLKENHKLVGGVRQFLATLESFDITPVAISNGAFQIADEMLAFHQIPMPRVCNSLVMDGANFVAMNFFHDENDGIRKGDLAHMAAELGHEVVGCAGDSKGDVGLAIATSELGGLIIAVGDHGLKAWCEEQEGAQIRNGCWIGINDYAEAQLAIQSRVAGS